MLNSSDDLCLSLKRLYGFKHPTIIKQIETGYKAASFVVNDGEYTFFVKRYHPKRSPERLLEVHRVKMFFKEHGVSTIPPLLNSEGSTLLRINEESFAVFPYVADKQYYGLPNDRAVASAGENLARLHLAGADHLSLVSRVFKPWDRGGFLENARKMLELANAGTTSFDAMASKMLKIKMQSAEDSHVSYEDLGLKNDVILHGDYHTHNLFFDENDNVSFTFDFERTMVGPRATDLAYGLFMICFDFNTDIEGDVSDIHFERARSFIRAYNEVFPIAVDQFLNGLCWFFWSQIVYIQWPLDAHYFEADTRADKLLAKRLNRLEYFAKNFDVVLDRFCSVTQSPSKDRC